MGILLKKRFSDKVTITQTNVDDVITLQKNILKETLHLNKK